MANLRTFQPSFNAGILSPSLWARVDLAKYQSGMKEAQNVVVHAHGGVSNRPGLQFIDELLNGANAGRLIPFMFNTEQTYILAFNTGKMRIYKDGGVILKNGVPYEVTIPYSYSALKTITYVQEGDVMYLCHEDYPIQKVSRYAEDNWVVSPMEMEFITYPEACWGSPRYRFRTGNTAAFGLRVSAVYGGKESAASATVTVSWQYEVYDGRYIRLDWDPSTLDGNGVYPRYRIYRTDSNVGLVGETSELYFEFPTGPGAFVGDGTAAPTTSQSGAPTVPTGVSGKVSFGKTYEYCVTSILENGNESKPSPVCTMMNDLSIAGNTNVLEWKHRPIGTDEAYGDYYIYKRVNGQWGYIGTAPRKMTVRSSGRFIDDNIVPDVTRGPPEFTNPFSGAGNYPRCASFVEQRLAFASTKNEPGAVWMSQSGNYENFSKTGNTAIASDSVSFRIRGRQLNAIRALVAMKGLMVLTSGAEWMVTGDGAGAPITPSQIKIDNQGYRGCADVQPIVVGNTILFAQARGGVVRDFSYEFTNDSFTGKDITVLARHLFENKRIVAWDYAQAPNSIAWVVLDDGSLVSLTYMREQEIWAWTRHNSGASARFEDVVVISEGDEDVPYFIVRRKIGTVWKRYIERLHTRVFEDIEDAFFVDSGLTYSGEPVKTISGLSHLEGMTVAALADGNVVRDLVVTGGSVSLQFAASKVHIGLPYTAIVQTLDLDLGQVQGLGTVQGRMKTVSDVTLRMQDTRGIWIGGKIGKRGDDRLVEWKQRQSENYGEPVKLFTGDASITPHWDWSTSGSVAVHQFDPLPMTILAIMPDVVISKG